MTREAERSLHAHGLQQANARQARAPGTKPYAPSASLGAVSAAQSPSEMLGMLVWWARGSGLRWVPL